MEYDRALYRVYERAVEDLAATAPIHPPRNRNPASSVRRRVVPHHAGNAATTDQESQDHQPQNGSSTTSTATNANANTNTNTNAIGALDWSLPMTRGGSEAYRVIPFLVPLSMQSRVDALWDALLMEQHDIWDNDVNHGGDGDATIVGRRGMAHVRRIGRILWQHLIVGSCSREGVRLDGEQRTTRTSTSRWNCWRNIPFRRNGFIMGGFHRIASQEQVNEPTTPTRIAALSNSQMVEMELAPIRITTSGLRRRRSTHDGDMSATSIGSNYSSTSHDSLSDDGGESEHGSGGGGAAAAVAAATVTEVMDPPLESNTTSNAINAINANDAVTTNSAADPNNPMIQQRHVHNQAGEGGGFTQKGLFLFMRLTFILAVIQLYILIALNHTYIGPRISRKVMEEPIDRSIRSSNLVGDDGTPTKSISRTCLEYALETRPVEERGSYYLFNVADKSNETESSSSSANDTIDLKKEESRTDDLRSNSTTAKDLGPPLLGDNEILQIKILYGNECPDVDQYQCSRVRTMIDFNADKTINASLIESAQEESIGNETLDVYSTRKYWEEPSYKFSTNEALMYFDSKMILYHNVSLVNVTLTERCLATGSDAGTYSSFMTKVAKFMSQIYGMDTILINQFLYGIKTNDGKFQDGHIQNIDTKERWAYSKSVLELEHEMNHNIIIWFINKAGMVAVAFLAFFLVTSVTALIVRVLTSSGVAMMFPIFALFRSFGLTGADDRLLGLSYPWIGRARHAIGRRGLYSQAQFIGAHLSKLFLYYLMYEACQASWSEIVYFKMQPINMPLWIFGFAMIWEYFLLVFVRSALSVYLFPRLSLLYFMAYHGYFYSVLYGFFDVALIIWSLLMAHAMIFTIIALEVPASSRGAISAECPREVYTKLSWSEWNASLPNEWTLFLPLNSRYVPIHDRQAQANNDNNREEDLDEDTTIHPHQGQGSTTVGTANRATFQVGQGSLTIPFGNNPLQAREI